MSLFLFLMTSSMAWIVMLVWMMQYRPIPLPVLPVLVIGLAGHMIWAGAVWARVRLKSIKEQ